MSDDSMMPLASLLIGLSLCLGCHGTAPLLVDNALVSGTYLMDASTFKDELVLRRDGSMIRTVTRSAHHWVQLGRWDSHVINLTHSKPNTVVDFTGLTPRCAVLQTQPGQFPWSEPESPLCGRSNTAYFCYDQGLQSLCFDESRSYRYHHRE
jgi:hypothetical protein